VCNYFKDLYLSDLSKQVVFWVRDWERKEGGREGRWVKEEGREDGGREGGWVKKGGREEWWVGGRMGEEGREGGMVK
jgi:hypothetical protein